jgi:hypothetical protein
LIVLITFIKIDVLEAQHILTISLYFSEQPVAATAEVTARLLALLPPNIQYSQDRK